MKKIYTLLFSGLAITGLYSQSNFHLLQPASFQPECIRSGGLTKGSTFILNTSELVKLVQQAPENLMLNFDLPGEGNVVVDLQRKNIFSSDFKVSSSAPFVEPVDFGIHYQGHIIGKNKSLVAFSFFNHAMYGLIANNNGNYTIAALKDPVTKKIDDQYIIYNDRDLTIKNPFTCATDALNQPEKDPIANSSTRATTNCKTVTQYYECDFAMYNDNGSSVPNTVAFTTAMFNVVSGIYNSEGIDVEISEIFVWNTADPYPSASSFDALEAFGDNVQDSFNGDLAHLISTVPAGNGGVAWLNVLCFNYDAASSAGRFAYSNIDNDYEDLPLYSWTVHVVAHETGHNLGSNHTHWCGWELSPGVFGAIDSCYFTEEDDFLFQCYGGADVPRIGTIMSYCHLGIGINLNLGFGPLPSDRIRGVIGSAPCIAAPWLPGPFITQNINTLECTPDSIAGYTYQWYNSSDVLVASGSTSYNPTIAGIYYVVLTNSAGCSVTSNNFNFVPNTASISDLDENNIRLWPNPANSVLYIQLSEDFLANSADLQFGLFDLQGRLVLKSKANANELANVGAMNVETISSGFYMLEVISGNKKVKAKVVIKH